MNIMKKLILALGVLGMTLGSISAHSDSDSLIKSKAEVVILFYKPSCPFYRYIAPLFNRLSEQCKSLNIAFQTVDISHNDAMYKKTYGFSTVPTVIYFKNGTKQLSHGSNNKTVTTEQMRNNIKKVFGK